MKRKKLQLRKKPKQGKSCKVIFFSFLFSVVSFGVINLWFRRDLSSLSNRQEDRKQLERVEDGLSFVRQRPYGLGFYPREIEDLGVELLNETNLSEKTWIDCHCGLITWQSNEHLYNQDRAALIQPFVTLQTRGTESFLLMIFDGHGELGDLMASYAREETPRRLAEKLNSRPCCQSQAWIQQQLYSTFLEVNEEAPPNYALRGGCTASVTLRIGNLLFFANVGDSRTILVQSDTDQDVNLLYTTRLDKPHLPQERARIEKLGGKIHIPKDFPKDSRVFVYSVAAIPHETIGLAMSRSLGDWEWKPDGVIAEPMVDIIDLNMISENNQSKHLFLLAASDGLWDFQDPLFYAKQLAPSIHRQTNSFFFTTLRDIFVQVAPKHPQWYRDDMTAIVVQILGIPDTLMRKSS